jgi:hypothetical protein
MMSRHSPVAGATRPTSPLVAILASLLGLFALFSMPAYGSTVTVGPQLPLVHPDQARLGCESACTLTNSQLPLGASYRAPISGVIVRWRLFGATQLGAGYRLRVLRQTSGVPYIGIRSSPLQSPTSNFETFPANLPIEAGQTVAINLESPGSVIGFEVNSSAPTLGWEPPIGDQKLRSPTEGEGLVLGFNADIQPPPVIESLASVKGPLQGGTEVTITGTDFSGATAVSFGAVPAASFVVESDTQITAYSPRASAPGSVPVSVTTPAGVVSSPFRYLACVVPKLKHRSLRAAKARLRKARCRIGRVTQLDGARARSAKVSSQSPRPGSVRKPGSRVRVTLSEPQKTD